MTKAASQWITAADAVRRLGVKRPTLYAYVSRGLIRSSASGGPTRERLYAREDVERLRRRAEERRHPEAIAAHALDLGTPVLESSITLIDHGRLFYRGHDAVQLARTRSIAEVASLLWTGRFDAVATLRTSSSKMLALSDDLPFIARAQMLLASAAAHDPTAFDLRTDALVASGSRILGLMARAAALTRPSHPTIDAELATAWEVRSAVIGVLRAAIILCADHELNVSAFTARCVASAGANPYAAVVAGLSALDGVRHGGMTARVESMLASMRHARSGRAAVAERLRHGEELLGFGHPLYPDGDPRADALFSLLREHAPKSPELRFALDVAAAATATLDAHPSLDFALATVARVLRLPAGSGLTLFALGRTMGWIAHTIEQYTVGQLIRPRARYVGPMPVAT
jgi:citrate synthase